MKALKVLLFFVFIFPNISLADECGVEEKHRCLVSIINLVSTPEHYHGKYIMVSGYLDTNLRGGYDRYWLSLNSIDFDPPSMINLDVKEVDMDILRVKNGAY